MNDRPLEMCCVCDEPTGHAGVGDGSIFCNCDAGPFCDECYRGHWCVDKEEEDDDTDCDAAEFCEQCGCAWEDCECDEEEREDEE